MTLSSPSRAPLVLVGGFALFLAAIAYLVASSFTRRSAPTFEPTPPTVARPLTADVSTARADTFTVDASDENQWQFFDLERGRLIAPPDTAGWDLAFRRYRILAADALADVGDATAGGQAVAPASGYRANTGGSDSANAAIRRWYRYSMMTHLLEPNGHSYVARTREGSFVRLEILSYYCPGLKPGCVTFRYARLRAPEATS